MSINLKKLFAILAMLAMLAAACGSEDTSDDAGDDTEESTDAAEDSSGDDDEMSEEDSDDDMSEESDDDMSEDDMSEEDHDDDADGASATGGDELTLEADGAGTNVGLTFDIGGRGDQSFNDSAAAGMDRAIADFGVTATEAEPNEDGSNRAELLQLQADQSQLVIPVGFLFRDDVIAVAEAYPDVHFAVIDDGMLGEDGSPVADNVAGLTFAEEQGSFLVGAAAALKSETNTIGFIGGVGGFGLIEKFEAGFIAGAQAVNPDVTVTSQYITQAPDFDGFFAADRAQEIALQMYEQGADVIYHAAGGSGAGLFEAAKSTSEGGNAVWAIGVDSDQYYSAPGYEDYILTSMLKRVDNAVYSVSAAHLNGEFAAGNTVYDLSTNGVGYSTSGGHIDDIVAELEDFKAQIVAGDITVPTAP